jgi:hypothetical protein
MVSLTPMESEVLGEMAWDSYSLGEVVYFVRDANPPLDEFGLYRAVITLLESWIPRGWLMLAKRPFRPHFLSSIEQVLPYLAEYGPEAIAEESTIPLPEVELTDQAFRDVEWLRGLV